MDFHKLKLEKFKTYNGFNLPNDFDPPLSLDENPEVYFLFCESFEDLNRYTNIVLNKQTHKENRIFYIYKKGQKQFHRDHIGMYFKKSPFLKMKAPILCSLSKTYSCFTCMIVR